MVSEVASGRNAARAQLLGGQVGPGYWGCTCRWRGLPDPPDPCSQGGLADLGTSGWGSPAPSTGVTVVPNRTGVRETERSLGQTSAQARRGDCISVTSL